MADPIIIIEGSKISELPDGVTPTGDELMELVQGGINVKLPLAIIRANAGSLLVTNYLFNIDVDETDPGAGKIKLNDEAVALTTELYINDMTQAPIQDISASIADLKTGDAIRLQLGTNPNNFVTYKLTGIAVDNTGWWTIPVEFFQGAGPVFTNAAPLSVVFIFNAGGGQNINIYTDDGTLEENRIVNADGKSLTIQALNQFLAGGTGTFAFETNGKIFLTSFADAIEIGSNQLLTLIGRTEVFTGSLLGGAILSGKTYIDLRSNYPGTWGEWRLNGVAPSSPSTMFPRGDGTWIEILQHFRGVYVDLAALQAAVPVGSPGDYAFVDAGVGNNPSIYLWDNTDNAWVLGGSAPTPDASETVKGVTEEATDVEVAAGTSVGGTGAKLFVNPTKLQTWWTAIKSAAITFTSWVKGSQFVTLFQTLTDAATIAWNADLGAFAQVTLGGNRTLGAVTNMQTGGLFILRVIQDAAGTRTLAFNAQYTFPGTVTPILNTGSGAATVLVFFYDGTNMRYCNASGDYKLANLYLQAQAAAGSDQRPLYIDSTGKVFKSAFVNFDETNKKVVITGGTTTNVVVFELLNSALSSIMKLYNDQVVEFGGSTAVMSILSGVGSGGAYLELNSNQAEGFKIIDKAANVYTTIITTTGGVAIKSHQKLINDQGLGFEKVTVQAFLTSTGAASATNLITFVAIPTDFAIDITVNHLFAYEQTDGDVIIANGGRKGAARNVGGTVSGAFDTFTSLLLVGSGTPNWSMVADNTNKRININFINGAAGGVHEVALDFSYILRPLPTV